MGKLSARRCAGWGNCAPLCWSAPSNPPPLPMHRSPLTADKTAHLRQQLLARHAMQISNDAARRQHPFQAAARQLLELGVPRAAG